MEMQDYGSLQNIVDFCRKLPIDIFEGVVVTDQQGIIVYVNEKHSAFYGRKTDEEIGNSIEVLNKCSVFPHVITTGVPIVGRRLCVKGREFVGSVVPIKLGDRVVGAIGIAFCSNIKLLQGLLTFSTTDLVHLKKSASHNSNIFFEDIIGESAAFREAKEMAMQIAPFEFPVLLQGETGTGKSMFAKAIHNASPRKHFPFVIVNCAAIPKDLFETEMFGYAPGAFSGSNPKGKPGKFEIADKGTIFLDEIGSLPLDQQTKLLDILDEKELVRVGGVNPVAIDFRLITATNEDLERKVLDHTFRSDLYYRINVAKFSLPSLRERTGDIPLLIEYKLKKIRESHSLRAQIILEQDFMNCLMDYSFPGNLRELFNILEQNVINKTVHKRSSANWPFAKREVFAQSEITPLKKVVDQAERAAIMHALKRTRGDVADAAKKLDINRTTLYKKIERFKLNLAADRS
jgi:transcriptional regulator with PAS, ATPase and Fis domain